MQTNERSIVVFDSDGLIGIKNSVAFLLTTLANIFHLNIKEIFAEFVTLYEMMRNKEVDVLYAQHRFHELFPDLTPHSITSVQNSLSIAEHAVSIDGRNVVLEVLTDLQQRGYELAVLSCSYHELIEASELYTFMSWVITMYCFQESQGDNSDNSLHLYIAPDSEGYYDEKNFKVNSLIRQALSAKEAGRPYANIVYVGHGESDRGIFEQKAFIEKITGCKVFTIAVREKLEKTCQDFLEMADAVIPTMGVLDSTLAQMRQ